jgi:hypothetical protein
VTQATKRDPLKREVDELRAEVTRLRDEIRVRLHLGAMDARDAFAQLERDIEHTARDASQSAQRARSRSFARLRELAEAIREPPASSKTA